MLNLSIRQLEVFVTIARLGSFADAGKLLHLTSPALSLIIKAIEEGADFKVFDRTTRSVKLTQAGQALLPQANRVLAEHRNLMQSVDNIRQKRSGIVRVAATQLLSCTLLPPACSRFEAMWPDIHVVPVDTLFEQLQQLLLRGDADVGVGPERICDSDIVATPVLTSRLNVACSTSHPFAGRESVRWSELAGQNLIISDRGAAPLMARDANYQVVFDRIYEVGHYTTALAQANENKGIVVGAAYTRKLLRSFNMVLVPLVEPVTMRKIMQYRSRRHALSPAAERFAGSLADLLAPAGVDEAS